MSARDVIVTDHGAITHIELNRPPHNYFDAVLLADLRDLLARLAEDPLARAVVLSSRGRSFCAGADFSGEVAVVHPETGEHLYRIAADLFDSPVPIVAALHGAVIGGGLGLAMVADQRVAVADSRIAANFARLGFHPGFGLSASVAWTIGAHRTAVLLGQGETLSGAEAFELGLVDAIADEAALIQKAFEYAERWASAAPLAVRSIRRTNRAGLIASVAQVLERELGEQQRLVRTRDWAEGIVAARERRAPVFEGK